MANGLDEAVGFNPRGYKYDAFISYAHADKGIVDDLYNRLQKYRAPKSLQKEKGDFGPPPKRLRLFMDRRSAQTGETVSDRLMTALESSAFLIVMCSVNSSESKWVGIETQAFLERAGSRRILPVFIREDKDQAIASVLTPALRQLGDRLPFGADLIIDGGPEAVSHKLIGGLIGVPQDRVAREQEKADKRQRRIERTALVTISGLAVGAATAGWFAYDQAQKARATLRISLNALDQTTPFASRMVSEGRIKLADVAPWKTELDSVFGSYEAQQLESLPDVRYSLGQVMLASSSLSASMGSEKERLLAARRAQDLLETFKDDIGPTPQLLLCDAYLHQALVHIQREDFTDASSLVSRCKQLLAFEQRYAEAPSDLIPLAYKTIYAHQLSNEIDLAQEQFESVLSDQLARRHEPILDELAPVAAEHAAYLQSMLDSALAETYRRMGRYKDARSAYAAAESRIADLSLSTLDKLPLLSGKAQTLSVLAGGTEDALEIADALILAISDKIAEDVAQRALQAALAELLLLKASILEDQLRQSDLESATESARRVEQTLLSAGELLGDLVEFDPENRRWARAYAFQQSDLGEFYFRLFESFGSEAPLCRQACLDQAEAALLNAHSILETFPNPLPNLARIKVDIELYISRTLRLAERPDAKDWMSTAEISLTQIDATRNPRALQFLAARVADEKADLLAFEGRGR
ncbi:MAG: toll/interleukin-1 receptor domain-containing protein, partial [Pseudomonadota bacterium]